MTVYRQAIPQLDLKTYYVLATIPVARNTETMKKWALHSGSSAYHRNKFKLCFALLF